MTSGNPIHRLLILALLGLPATPWAASPSNSQADSRDSSRGELDADALITHLARPAPAAIDFTEVRFSRLLREPLIVSGELGYEGPTSLDRRVTVPYQEHTSIRGESVKVEREGEKPRSFALKHAPELRGLLSGFSAMLSGDPSTLRQTFGVKATGGDNAWTLELTPVDAKAKRRLQEIEVRGAHNEPRCFSMKTADGTSSVLLLGAAAKESVPKDVTLESLAERCGAPLTP